MGQGTWYFLNGNTINGTFEQKAKQGDDDAEISDPELDENGNPIRKQLKINLTWTSEVGLADAAHLVNSVVREM